MIGQGLTALARADIPAAARAARAVTRSSVEDMMKLLTPKLTPEVRKPEVKAPAPSSPAPKPR